MAEILEHPTVEYAKEKPWDFPDGSSILITVGEGQHLTLQKAIYMLDDVKFRIHKMNYEQ